MNMGDVDCLGSGPHCKKSNGLKLPHPAGDLGRLRHNLPSLAHCSPGNELTGQQGWVPAWLTPQVFRVVVRAPGNLQRTKVLGRQRPICREKARAPLTELTCSEASPCP